MEVPKPMLTEFGIHYRLESCVWLLSAYGALCRIFFKGKLILLRCKKFNISPLRTIILDDGLVGRAEAEYLFVQRKSDKGREIFAC